MAVVKHNETAVLANGTTISNKNMDGELREMIIMSSLI